MNRKAESAPSWSKAEYKDRKVSDGAENGEVHKGHGGLLVDENTPKPASRLKCGLVALSYMGCAISLIVFNKAALSAYRFPYPNVITLSQLCCSTAILAVLSRFGLVSFTDDQGSKQNRYVSTRLVWTALPMCLAYLLYMVLGMYSIRGVNLPMYTTLRRTTVAFTMFFEYATVAGKSYPPKIMASVAAIVLGALIAGANDFSFDAYGYALVFASNVSTAVYLNTIARIGKKTPLNSFGMMWCNGLVCTPALLVVTACTGELSASFEFEHLYELAFIVIMGGSCMLAFALNYTIFLNTSLNSALTQTICGNLKDGIVIAIGFFSSSMDSVTIDFLNIVGITLGLVGSCMYAYVKLFSVPAK